MTTLARSSPSAVLADIVADLAPGRPVRVAPTAARGRVLACDVPAPTDLPPEPRAAMDGVAVRAGDVTGASASGPVRLPVDGASLAGRDDQRPVQHGHAREVATGATLPPGTDAVVRLEDLERRGGDVLVRVAVAPGRDVRPRGDDARQSDVLVDAGTRIGTGALAGLAGAGVTTVEVWPAPRVVVVPTGDEVVAGTTPDAVGPALAHLLTADGADVELASPVADEQDALSGVVSRYASDADVVLTIGGASVGPRDHAGDLVGSLPTGHSVSVAVRPGRPFAWGRTETGCTVLCVPGSPVAAVVSAVLFARPLVARLAGAEAPGPTRCRLAATVHGDTERRCLVPAEWGRAGTLRPVAGHGSANLARLASTAALVDLPAGAGELPPGAGVDAWVLP